MLRGKAQNVVRVLVNGQYENLRKNSYYTDDYAWDNACNFREGLIKNVIEFTRKIIENTIAKCFQKFH